MEFCTLTLRPSSLLLAAHKSNFPFQLKKVFSYFKQRTSEGNNMFLPHFSIKRFPALGTNPHSYLSRKKILNVPYANCRVVALSHQTFRVCVGIRISGFSDCGGYRSDFGCVRVCFHSWENYKASWKDAEMLSQVFFPWKEVYKTHPDDEQQLTVHYFLEKTSSWLPCRSESIKTELLTIAFLSC